jgi:hypothetical protein
LYGGPPLVRADAEDEGGSTWWLELSEDAAPARRFDIAGQNDEDSAFAIWPRMHVRTWPGRLAPDSDSTTDPPLRRSDLRWAIDRACTYRRRIAFDLRQSLYLPDSPLPACADYFDF